MVSTGEAVLWVDLADLSNENAADALTWGCAVADVVVVENGECFGCCVDESVG